MIVQQCVDSPVIRPTASQTATLGRIVTVVGAMTFLMLAGGIFDILG